MKLKYIIIILVLLLLFGCGETRVDTTSYESLVKSLGKIRATLPENKKKEFDEYSMIMAFYEVDPKMLGATGKPDEINNGKINKALNGKTGEEILKEGPKYKTNFELINKEKLIQEHNKIMTKKNDAIMSKKQIQSFKVVKSKLLKEKVEGSETQKPVLELNVKNETDQTVFKAFFDWELTNTNNKEQKGEQDVVYEIPAGLNPNSSASFKIYPKITDIEISSEFNLKVLVKRLEDKNGNALFIGNSLTKEEEERLNELKTILQIQK